MQFMNDALDILALRRCGKWFREANFKLNKKLKSKYDNPTDYVDYILLSISKDFKISIDIIKTIYTITPYHNDIYYDINLKVYVLDSYEFINSFDQVIKIFIYAGIPLYITRFGFHDLNKVIRLLKATDTIHLMMLTKYETIKYDRTRPRMISRDI